MNRVGSMFTFFFTDQTGDRLGIREVAAIPPASAGSSAPCWSGAFTWRPRSSKRPFVSAAHTDEDVSKTIAAARDAFQE